MNHIRFCRFLVVPTFAAVSAWPCGLESQFLYINSASQQVARFEHQLSRCSTGTRAFATLLTRIDKSQPLRTQLLDSLGTVLFGTPADLRSSEPLLTIDLGDIDRLPAADDVRSWAPDSSWAWTICEVLAHEIAETISYRQEWRKRPSGETTTGANAWFGERRRASHLHALQVEDEVASEQRTRVREDGTPYSRTRECFASKGTLIVFGENTQVLVAGSGPPRISYYSKQDLCASL